MPRALAELEHYAFLEQMELAPLKELADRVRASSATGPKVRTYGEMATFITRTTARSCRPRPCVRSSSVTATRRCTRYDTMLAARSRRRAGRRSSSSAARRRSSRLGKKAEAKAALALAKKTEPENAEVLELKAKLK